jgi:hypothetical protein
MMTGRGSFGLANPSQVRRGGLNFRRERPEVSITPSYVRGLYLNDRDRAVVRFLSEIGYATTDQLRRMFWPDNAPQTASGRLLDLWEMWVLDRQPFYQLPDYGVAPQLVYMLGRAGVKMLQDLDENVTRRDGTLLMGHNVMLGEAVVRLVETARALGDGHDVSFLGEAAAYTAFKWEGQWARMRPDGLIYLEVDGKELPFYVEFDRGTRPLDHVIGKVKQYDLYRRSKDWKRERRVFPGIMVVVWTRYSCDGLSAEAAAERRRAKAQRRLDGVIERLQKMTRQSGLRWFCQRLDLVGKKPWRVVTADGLKQAPAFFTRNGHKRG